MIDITKQVIKQLSKNPLFSLFFSTHFEIRTKKSLRPVFTDKGMHFPEQVFIHPKTLNLLDKILYYYEDLKLWSKMKL